MRQPKRGWQQPVRNGSAMKVKAARIRAVRIAASRVESPVDILKARSDNANPGGAPPNQPTTESSQKNAGSPSNATC